jgi:hypothetical protein
MLTVGKGVTKKCGVYKNGMFNKKLELKKPIFESDDDSEALQWAIDKTVSVRSK